MVISLVIISPSVNAENISLISPEKVNTLENFSVNVDYKSNDILDIKIAIQDKESKVYSEIYDSGWKSSFYYLSAKYPAQKEYVIRAKKSGEELSLCIRFRKGGKVLADKACNPISIVNVDNTQNENSLEPIVNSREKTKEKEEDLGIKEDQESLEEKEEDKKEMFLPAQEFNKSEAAPPLKIINLTESKKEGRSSNSQGAYTSSQEKLNYTMITIFPLALLIILSFLIYKALRKI